MYLLDKALTKKIHSDQEGQWLLIQYLLSKQIGMSQLPQTLAMITITHRMMLINIKIVFFLLDLKLDSLRVSLLSRPIQIEKFVFGSKLCAITIEKKLVFHNFKMVWLKKLVLYDDKLTNYLLIE